MSVRYVLEDDYVLVTCEGEFDGEDIRTQCEEIVKACGSRSPLRVLVEDVDAKYSPSADELRALAIVLEQTYHGIPLRIAVCVMDDIHFGREEDNLIYVSSTAGRKKIAAYAVYH